MKKGLKIVLTGDLRVGKSTIIDKFIDYFDTKNISYGGYRTFSVDEDDHKLVYIIPSKFRHKLVNSGEKSTLEFCEYKLSSKNLIGNRNNKMFNVKILEDNAIKFLDDAIKDKDIIIIDEIGFLENETLVLKEKLKILFDDKNITAVVVLRKMYNELYSFISSNENVNMFTLTKENRDYIFNDIIHKVEI